MSDFTLLIIIWYRQNSRDLPWRNTNNPYFIWLSEIILQQTRVEQGLPYYKKFIKNFPTIESLANSDEQKVLNLWQGLGYYSRARNLHTAAKQVVSEFNGEFPKTFSEIKTLKGIGDYTAAAIASFAYDLPHAVVDGNVFRVLSRYFDDSTPIDTSSGKNVFSAYAHDLIPKDNPAEFNQAIMELGALICKPKNPLCDSCPVQETCISRRKNNQHELPVKAKKTKVSQVYFYYLYLKGRQIPIEKRTKGIWQNMYQLPLIESNSPLEKEYLEKESLKAWGFKLIGKKPVQTYTHILSHQRIYASFWEVEKINESNQDIKEIKLAELVDLPLPRLITRFFEDEGIEFK